MLAFLSCVKIGFWVRIRIQHEKLHPVNMVRSIFHRFFDFEKSDIPNPIFCYFFAFENPTFLKFSLSLFFDI